MRDAVADEIIWGIHGGQQGAADQLFKNHNVIAIGWPDLGPLGDLNTRDEFKQRYEAAHPGQNTFRVATIAGQLFRFVREMEPGNLVVYPSKISHDVWLGHVTGAYEHRPDLDSHYCNARSVAWSKQVPRTSFSQGALYEMGSALTLFQIKEHADEVRAQLGSKAVVTVPEDEDEAVAQVTEDIEQQARDFVIKRLATHLKGHGLAELVADLLRAMGYRTRVSPPGKDRGVDIIAHPDELGFSPPIVKVQVKSSTSAVGSPEVSQLYGVVANQEYALFVALGGYSPDAKQFASSRTNYRIIDGHELVELIFRYYDALDPRFKAVIPLKRALIPEVLDQPN
jgi:restriction system protein